MIILGDSADLWGGGPHGCCPAQWVGAPRRQVSESLRSFGLQFWARGLRNFILPPGACFLLSKIYKVLISNLSQIPCRSLQEKFDYFCLL